MKDVWPSEHHYKLVNLARELNHVPGVYAIKNVKTGRLYIGQSENVGKRLREHLTGIDRTFLKIVARTTYPNDAKPRMLEDFKTHGIESFEVMLIKRVDELRPRLDFERSFTIHIVGSKGKKSLYSSFHARKAVNAPQAHQSVPEAKHVQTHQEPQTSS